jgi:AraC-like DNA-binding protein
LQRHTIFRSRDVDETHGFIEGHDFWLELSRRDGTPLDVHVNGVYLGDAYLGYAYYGPAMAMRAAPKRTDYWILLPTGKRRLEVSHAGSRVVCDRNRGAVNSPVRENLIRSEAGCGRLVLSVPRHTLARELSALLDSPIDEAIDFAPALELDTGYGASLARFVRSAALDFDHSEALLANKIALARFEQFIVTTLLLSHPHNYSARLHAPHKAIAPGDIKRAINYVEAHLDESISLADIVAAVGVPGRTLCKHFRDFAGVSPMAYVRNARFARVRDALLRASSEENVSLVAAKLGFEHFGRFAVEYRRRFGERPSDTLKRQRLSRRRAIV